jgi:hypothetical protein
MNFNDIKSQIKLETACLHFYKNHYKKHYEDYYENYANEFPIVEFSSKKFFKCYSNDEYKNANTNANLDELTSILFEVRIKSYDNIITTHNACIVFNNTKNVVDGLWIDEKYTKI